MTTPTDSQLTPVGPHWDYETNTTSDPTNEGGWTITKRAIINILNKYKGHGIQFGLDFFPDYYLNYDYCEVSIGSNNLLLIDTALDKEDTIISSLPADNAPYGATPLWCILDIYLHSVAIHTPNFARKSNDSYLLLVSDGQDTCGKLCQSGYSVTAAQLGQITKDIKDNNDIKTFAIGYGGNMPEDELNAIASNGGTSFTEFIPAENQAELEKAFDDIAETIISCSYDIYPPDGADKDQINFYFEDSINLPMDEDCSSNTGWMWLNTDKTKMTFCKDSCDELKNGNVTTVSARWGCPTVPIE